MTRAPGRSSVIGLVGLGVMGRNLALNLSDHGIQAHLWDVDTERAASFLAEHRQTELHAAESVKQLVERLERPRRLLLMVQAGQAVDDILNELLPYLAAGDLVIDGGNSHYRCTERRQQLCESRDIQFIGMGVSGGEHGARFGPSLMPGGAAAAYALVEPELRAIAAKSQHGDCVTHVGPGSAGHFVKMVHNGIEYAEMQLLAEAYDFLSRGLGLDAHRVADIFERYNQGSLNSFLLELTVKVLRKTDLETGRPLVDQVVDQAGQKGTGRWTVEAALELGVPIPSIDAAVTARGMSALKSERTQAAEHIRAQLKPLSADPAHTVEALESAMQSSRWVCHAQGFALIATASQAYGWNIALGEIARVWTGGCILRSEMLGVLVNSFGASPSQANLLLAPEIERVLLQAQPGWRECVAGAALAGIPAVVMGSSLNYFDSYRSARLPQNLTQAQRDAFGAHTYQRTDRPNAGFVHSEWLK